MTLLSLTFDPFARIRASSALLFAGA